MNEAEEQSPHNALRIIEAKLHRWDTYIGTKDPVWPALDRLWEHVINGK